MAKVNVVGDTNTHTHRVKGKISWKVLLFFYSWNITTPNFDI